MEIHLVGILQNLIELHVIQFDSVSASIQLHGHVSNWFLLILLAFKSKSGNALKTVGASVLKVITYCCLKDYGALYSNRCNVIYRQCLKFVHACRW